MRVLVIANPLAGSSGNRWRIGPPALELLQVTLQKMGVEFDLHLTIGPGDASETARAAALNGYDLVVAAGGDGTVHEVVNGLAGTPAQLGLIPIGTENVLAREMGIPFSIEKACVHMLGSEPRDIDLGLCGDRYFACFAGVGFDGFVASNLNAELKDAIGSFAYVWTALEKVAEYRGQERLLRLVADGLAVEEMPFWQMMVGNIQAYGGNLRPTPRARVDDGLLDVVVLPAKDFPSMIQQVMAVATGSHLDLADVLYLQVRELRVETIPPEQVQLDGEVDGLTPVLIRVVPGALRARF
ncbi:MAG: diacylglycerol kinase family lipid kinase [Armatimonadetes bacterium]|nr:diacylglycerol kinase family lipid kinase [Armatimonadota bacterium]